MPNKMLCTTYFQIQSRIFILRVSKIIWLKKKKKRYRDTEREKVFPMTVGTLCWYAITQTKSKKKKKSAKMSCQGKKRWTMFYMKNKNWRAQKNGKETKVGWEAKKEKKTVITGWHLRIAMISPFVFDGVFVLFFP